MVRSTFGDYLKTTVALLIFDIGMAQGSKLAYRPVKEFGA
jgi:hypothetical protein